MRFITNSQTVQQKPLYVSFRPDFPPPSGTQEGRPLRQRGADGRSLRGERSLPVATAQAPGSSPHSRCVFPKVAVQRVDRHPAQLHTTEKGKENSPGAPLASLSVTEMLSHQKPGSLLLCNRMRAAVCTTHSYKAPARKSQLCLGPRCLAIPFQAGFCRGEFLCSLQCIPLPASDTPGQSVLHLVTPLTESAPGRRIPHPAPHQQALIQVTFKIP